MFVNRVCSIYSMLVSVVFLFEIKLCMHIFVKHIKYVSIISYQYCTMHSILLMNKNIYSVRLVV